MTVECMCAAWLIYWNENKIYCRFDRPSFFSHDNSFIKECYTQWHIR